MMKTVRLFALYFFLLSLLGCVQKREEKAFNGEIVLVDKIGNVKLPGKEVALKGEIVAGTFFIHDSIVIFHDYGYPNHFFRVFNLNDGSFLGGYCRKGRAGISNREFVALAPNHLYVENDRLYMLLETGEEVLSWNITGSLEHGEAVYDWIIPFEYRVKYELPIGFAHRITDSLFVAYVQPSFTDYEDRQASLPAYVKIDTRAEKIVSRYDPFKEEYTCLKNLSSWAMLQSFYCVHPDGSKLASGMYLLSQLNIIDLESGEIKGYRMRGTPDFSIFKSDRGEYKTYYSQCLATEDFIYGLYSGESRFPSGPNGPSPRFVHVYDWDGNLVRSLELEHPVDSIGIDSENKLLYGKRDATETLYVFDLNGYN